VSEYLGVLMILVLNRGFDSIATLTVNRFAIYKRKANSGFQVESI